MSTGKCVRRQRANELDCMMYTENGRPKLLIFYVNSFICSRRALPLRRTHLAPAAAAAAAAAVAADCRRHTAVDASHSARSASRRRVATA